MSPGKPKQASRPLKRKDVEKAAMDAAKMRADAKAKVGAICPSSDNLEPKAA